MLPAHPIVRCWIASAIAPTMAAVATWLSSTEVNILVVPDAGAAGTSLRAVVYSGSADDPPGKEGLASLTARVMLQEMTGRAGALGAGLHASVGKDVTVFSGAAGRTDRERLIDLFVSAMTRPAFDAAVVDAQRTSQRQALDAALHDPETLAREAFDALVFRGHPYAHPALGRPASLEKIGRDDLAAFHEAHWRKGNLAVGVSGDGADASAAKLRQDLAALPDGEPDRQPRAVSWLPRPRVVVVEEPSASSRSPLRIGHLLDVTRAHPDYFALRLAAQLAADGSGAAAPLDVRVEITDPEDGLAGSPGLARRQQAFVIAASPAPTAAADIVRDAFARLGETHQAAPDATRIAALKRVVGGRPPYPAGNSSLELAELMDELLFRTPGFAQRYAAGLEATGADAVKGFVSRALHPDRLAVVAVVPDAKGFTAALVAVSPAPAAPALTADDIDRITAETLER